MGVASIDDQYLQKISNMVQHGYCSNNRATRNKVFEGLANWGKSSIGWFFGFKLHLIINDKGELLSSQVTPGNVDDRVSVKDLVEELFGKLYGDKIIVLLTTKLLSQ